MKKTDDFSKAFYRGVAEEVTPSQLHGHPNVGLSVRTPWPLFPKRERESEPESGGWGWGRSRGPLGGGKLG